ncbi:MAG: class I SAM-dependent methyltransferase [Actinomycetota bacterium]
MDSKAIREKIDSFERWHYQFTLDGHVTPIHPPQRVNAHEQRKRYFFDPLVELCGGSLAGKRVLDLGCNAGFWSLEALTRGADYVLGVDGRQMHVDQANFVYEVKGIDKSKYDFRLANVFELDPDDLGTFDIVLCLGLMYHVSKHVELMEIMASVNDDVLVIDTLLSVAPGSYLRVRSEDPENPIHAADRDLVMSPTKRAVADMAAAFGYDTVVLKPRFTDYTGAKNYRQARRRAFICSKKTPLSRIAAPTEDLGIRGHLMDYVWLARDNAKLVPKKLKKKIGH